MKLTHITLLAGTIASTLSFSTFAGDLVSVQFSDGRPAVTGVEAVNKALNPIGVNVVSVDIPDAARPLLEASHRRALTKAEHGALIAAFNLSQGGAAGAGQARRPRARGARGWRRHRRDRCRPLPQGL